MPTEIIEIQSANGRATARIAPELGFNCFSFQVMSHGEAVELLWADPDFADGTKRPTRTGIPILFPFAGRIGGATFRYGGREYLQEVADGGNAIHGFVCRRPWRVVERSVSRVVGEFQASLDDPALLERWPADFAIRVAYDVSGGKLRSDITLNNPDRVPLPCGLGLHGYYRVPLSAAGDTGQCLVRVPLEQHWQLVNSLPTGARAADELCAALTAGLPFAEAKLDDFFSGVVFHEGVGTGSVIDPQSQRSMHMTFDDQFPYCVMFTPVHREAVAIEPHTTVPDAFALGEKGVAAGLLLLAPGESRQLWFEVALAEG